MMSLSFFNVHVLLQPHLLGLGSISVGISGRRDLRPDFVQERVGGILSEKGVEESHAVASGPLALKKDIFIKMN